MVDEIVLIRWFALAFVAVVISFAVLSFAEKIFSFSSCKTTYYLHALHVTVEYIHVFLVHSIPSAVLG